MARPRGFRQGRSRTTPTGRGWEVGAGGSAVTTLSATGSAFLGSVVQPVGEKLTVLRTRGLFEMFLAATGASDGDGFFGAIGIGVASAAAVAVGIGSVPTPVTEAGWDGWLYHRFVGAHNPDITFGGSPAVLDRFEVDSKAMRKFDPFENLYAAIEVVEIGTATLHAFFDSRILVQNAGT